MPKDRIRFAPQEPLRISNSGIPAEYTQEVAATIKSLQETQRTIVDQIGPITATFENTFLPQIYLQNEPECCRGVLQIYLGLPSLKDSYTWAKQAYKMIDDFELNAYKDTRMYKLVKALTKSSEKLDPQSQRYLTLTYEQLIRGGAGIESSSLSEEFGQIERELRNLREAAREENINDDSGLWLDEGDLEGLPGHISAQWETQEPGQHRLCFKSVDVTRVLSFVKDEKVRRKIYIAYDKIRAGNVARIERAVTLRNHAARILGYPSHASKKLHSTMAGSPEVVADFLHDLLKHLQPLMREDLDLLLSSKSDELGEIASQLFLWDWPYYNRLRNIRGSLADANKFDENVFAEYFPLKATVPRVLDMVGDLVGIEFENMTQTPNVVVWHPDVQLYAAWNTFGDAKFLGYLYLDLVERGGKPRGESHTRVNPGFKKPHGTRHYPVSSVKCSFNKTTDTLPILLSSRQLHKLAHELGHAVHNLVSGTAYGRLHGTNTTRDFVEIPSLVLEKWILHPVVLKKLGYHYANLSSSYLAEWRTKTGKSDDVPPGSIPDDIIRRQLSAERGKSVKFYLIQVHYSLYDLIVHDNSVYRGAEKENLTYLWNLTKKDVTLLDGPEVQGEGYEWGFGQAKFSKLFTSHDVGYYAYPWSMVISEDIYSEIFKVGPMNREAGRHFRRTLLEPGASVPGKELLKRCLGREFRTEPFFASI